MWLLTGNNERERPASRRLRVTFVTVRGEIERFSRVAIGADLRAGGSFGEPVEIVPDTAPLERLVAFAGRQP